MKKIVFLCLLFVAPSLLNARQAADSQAMDSLDMLKSTLLIDTIKGLRKKMISADSAQNTSCTCPEHKFRIRQLIIPAALIGVGFVGLKSDWIEYQNTEIRNELQENIDSKITIDDFSQYAPMAAVYALNLCGMKGVHNFRDRTILLATSALIMGITTNVLKYTTKVQRPDGSSFNSFPSGHTAMAFMGAEFLWKEYHQVSPWIGVAGYAVASGTGIFRMYNNRHWLTDVLAGAGIGILSTKAAYWMFPFIQNKLFGNKNNNKHRISFIAAPIINKDEKGMSCVITF